MLYTITTTEAFPFNLLRDEKGLKAPLKKKCRGEHGTDEQTLT